MDLQAHFIEEINEVSFKFHCHLCDVKLLKHQAEEHIKGNKHTKKINTKMSNFGEKLILRGEKLKCEICEIGDINKDAKSINDHLHGSKHQEALTTHVSIQIDVEHLVPHASEVISFQTPQFPLSSDVVGSADRSDDVQVLNDPQKPSTSQNQHTTVSSPVKTSEYTTSSFILKNILLGEASQYYNPSLLDYNGNHAFQIVPRGHIIDNHSFLISRKGNRKNLLYFYDYTINKARVIENRNEAWFMTNDDKREQEVDRNMVIELSRFYTYSSNYDTILATAQDDAGYGPNYQEVGVIYKPKNLQTKRVDAVTAPQLETCEENKNKVTKEGSQGNPIYKLMFRSERNIWKTCYGGCNNVSQERPDDYLYVQTYCRRATKQNPITKEYDIEWGPAYVHFKDKCLKKYAKSKHGIHYQSFPMDKITITRARYDLCTPEQKIKIRDLKITIVL